VEENPDTIDEVPVQTDHGDGRVPVRGKTGAAVKPKQPAQSDQAAHHVNGVEAGQRKIEKNKKLNLRRPRAVHVEIRTGDEVLDIFMVILDSLQKEERRAEQPSGHEAPLERAPAVASDRV